MLNSPGRQNINFKGYIAPGIVYQLELFLSEVNNRETIAAIEANNGTYCLQKQIQKFLLIVMHSISILMSCMSLIYREQIESGDDLGSAFAVYHQGELVVNLVGGYADTEAHRPWTTDTISNVCSVTKGISAIVGALLVERYVTTIVLIHKCAHFGDLFQNTMKCLKCVLCITF